jgi:hypothetical protein
MIGTPLCLTVPFDISMHGCDVRTDRSITSDGFQFLLKDNYRQLWAFLTEYIRDAESRSSELRMEPLLAYSTNKMVS